MEQNQILKMYGTDFKETTKELLKEANLAGHIPSFSARIGLKPNLIGAIPASEGATTHPEVVAGIIEYLQEHGFFNIVIVEGSWVGDKTMSAVSACGYDKLIENYCVELIDTQKDSFYVDDCNGLPLKICSCMKDIDFLINVPVLKGHCQTRITCALKNMKGLIPNSEKRRFHAIGLHEPIAHLNVGIHQDFIVVDHICGDLDFEEGGNPFVQNCIMAAMDPVLLDSYVAKLLHYEVTDVRYITLAEQLHVGCADLDKAEIIVFGEDYAKELPHAKKAVELSYGVDEVGSCSACYGNLIPALDRLEKAGLLSKLDEQICIGQGYRTKTGGIGIGNCTKNFDFYVKGCPPTENAIFNALKKYIEAKKV
ncbi:MAG: DUF362 domain-containing protein [Firmicutes bacterium]|nr:DUF362 domain-containing protein [Bacillota bacterium]